MPPRPSAEQPEPDRRAEDQASGGTSWPALALMAVIAAVIVAWAAVMLYLQLRLHR
jgi:hypothetical protein